MSGAVPIVVVRFLPTGEPEFLAFEGPPVRLFVVDERCPGDKVSEVTDRNAATLLHALVRPGEPIGSKDDARHAALMARVEAARSGSPHLRIVE